MGHHGFVFRAERVTQKIIVADVRTLAIPSRGFVYVWTTIVSIIDTVREKWRFLWQYKGTIRNLRTGSN